MGPWCLSALSLGGGQREGMDTDSVGHLTIKKSTADLESFHNHILMYPSKRFSLSLPVYAARALLAGLDYNHHVGRPAKRRTDGSVQYI